MFNKIRKIDSSASPTPARAYHGPATAGVEWDIAEDALVIDPDGTRRSFYSSPRPLQLPIYVDTNVTTSGAGNAWGTAFKTMQEAFDVVESGGTIYFVGNVTEHLISPLGAQNVRIIGATTNPRHADTHPGGGELSGATWKNSGGANSPMLTLRNSGWELRNFLGVAHASNYFLELQRNAIETAVGEFDASHLGVFGVRFASGGGAIRDTGGVANVKLVGNSFEAVTVAILGNGNIGVGQSNWQILGNSFIGFDNGVKIAGFGCVIDGNYFTDGLTPDTTYVLNTNNGGGANNFVINNAFQTANAQYSTPDLVGCATDVWRNSLKDATDKSGTP